MIISVAMNLTNREIARRVRTQLVQDGMTLSKCCDDFNSQYSAEIKAKTTKPLNKDFLSRVSRNRFKVCTARISKLCEFLDIPNTERLPSSLEILTEQIELFRAEVTNDAELRKRYAAIERFLTGLNLQELLDGY